MGSPLGLTWTNAFLVHVEINWLQNYPSDVKPHYYRLYVDDIFVLFTSSKHLEAFRNFQHANISFTTENKKQNTMSFLDLQIIRGDKEFITSLYCKPTYFDSFLPSNYKFDII